MNSEGNNVLNSIQKYDILRKKHNDEYKERQNKRKEKNKTEDDQLSKQIHDLFNKFRVEDDKKEEDEIEARIRQLKEENDWAKDVMKDNE